MSQPEPSFLNIVALGSWNKKIFTPPWVNSNLYCLPKGEEIKGLFNPIELDIGYSSNGVNLFSKEDKVEIGFENLSSQQIVLATNILIRLFSILPHTPVKGIGFNVKFVLNRDYPSKFIKSLASHTEILHNDLNLIQTTHASKKENYKMNIVSTFLEKDYDVNFNFHYEKTGSFSENTFLDHIKEAQSFIHE